MIRRPPSSPLFPYTTLFRSLVDTLVSLPLDNNLVKAGPIGACFVYAWWSGGDEAETRRRRSTLLVTVRSEEHTSELQSRQYLVCRLLLEKKKNRQYTNP